MRGEFQGQQNQSLHLHSLGSPITSKGGPEQEHLGSVARGNCACLYSQALHRIPPPSPCDSIIHLPLISLWSESSVAQVMEAASHGQTDFPATGQDNLSPQVGLARAYVLGCLLTAQPCVWPNLGRNQICQPKGTSKGKVENLGERHCLGKLLNCLDSNLTGSTKTSLSLKFTWRICQLSQGRCGSEERHLGSSICLLIP